MNLKSGTTALQLLDGVDLTGKTAIVTGSNCGIGYEIARSLGKRGALVIMACRNEFAALEALNRIKTECPSAKVNFIRLALDEFKSVNDFVQEFSAKYDKLHYLFLNAATFGDYCAKTVDGFDTNYQVNYLSNALLTILLKDKLVSSSPTRVILTSTIGHSFFNLSAEDVTEERFKLGYDCWGSIKPYCHSKLLGLAISSKLSELWKGDGVSFYAFDAAHTNGTNLMRHWWVYKLVVWLLTFFNYSTQQAAAIAIYCAISPDLRPDKHFFFSNYKLKEPFMANDPVLKERTLKVTKMLLEKAGFQAKI